MDCIVHSEGIVPYQEMYDRQKKYVADVLAGGPGHLILCEHPTVVTLGRLAQRENILASEALLAAQGIEVVAIDRGGDVTLHAPGQLVAYPIIDLTAETKDLHAYLHKLEQVAIDFLTGFDIVAHRFPQKTGVWVADNKIASIGIGVRRWVTFHGIGININTNLDVFSLIRPCGLAVRMTSVAAHTGSVCDMAAARMSFAAAFCRQFQRRPVKE